MAGVLIGVSGGFPRLIPAVIAMAALLVAVSLPIRVLATPVAALAEGIAVVVVSTTPEPAAGNLMLCLLAPSMAAGIRGGYRWVAWTVASFGVVGAGLILIFPGDFDGQSLIALFQWTALSLGLGITAAWYAAQERSRDPIEQSYEDAVRALTELSIISRRLPTGLDVRTIAKSTLDDAARVMEASRGALVTFGYRGSYETASVLKESSTDWLDGVGALGDWVELAEGGRPAYRKVAGGVVCMQPIEVGRSIIGLVLLQAQGVPSPTQQKALSDVISRGSVPIQAALLFADVRDFATNEERSRIAREIHDGIAQDIAFLGYAADEIVESSTDATTRALAGELRREISRVVGDLRMSVFSLREGVSSSESLGAALGSYARRVFDDAPTDVHVTINESPHRLRPDIESELLRMAQEALTNARRHSDAANVWVTCSVDAPAASVTVEDDGNGMGTGRPDSFGLQIMRERAARISADMHVAPRSGGGTVVRIAL
jgi:signal transduction histidine kinase